MQHTISQHPAITPALLQHSYTYEAYLDLVNRLLEEGETTGTNHSEAMLDYTRLNVQRMKRVSQTVSLTPETIQAMQNITRKSVWLVLAEAWCGDVAINLPVIAYMAAQNPDAIQLRIVLRDENPVIMDDFLTNGARSIPKLIWLEAHTLTVWTSWGPRPHVAQQMVVAHKQNPTEPYGEFVKKLMLWYARDKGNSIQEEISKLAADWAAM
ncbi:thioredoxin family protein [Sphingobacteriales bacterium UPWRP_1]|nr:hypothetical protein BVG80_10290 [Sphingobacteriales bacterium TSM_CSM]PSJ72971.1 thioredoxin family protein [Sphingobacteriales bacterium UPWRP_1]